MKPEIGNDSSTSGSGTFFEHWAIYRKVIQFNYMGHDQIAMAISENLSGRDDINSMLDLGCGDAELPCRYMPDLGVGEYHGVDLAAKPLEHAEEKLAGRAIATHLHHRDQSQFLVALDRSFDLIVLGFALHHNTLEEKHTVLANAARRLNPGGGLLIYDVFRESGETRQAYLNRYLRWVRQEWSEITDREHELIDSHVRGNDYPATVAELQECARNTGLSEGQLLLSTCADFHRLFLFGEQGCFRHQES